MWYDSFHCCDMIFQRVRDDGTAVYQCECGSTLTVTYMYGTSTYPFSSGSCVTTGTIMLKGNTNSRPARQPVPAAFYKAFEDEDVDPGVVAFDCMCGTPLTIKKYSPESTISGTFCPVCGEQHWIRWSDGIVRHGEIGGK